MYRRNETDIEISDKNRIIRSDLMQGVINKITTVDGLLALESYLIGEIKEWIADEIISRLERRTDNELR